MNVYFTTELNSVISDNLSAGWSCYWLEDDLDLAQNILKNMFKINAWLKND